MTSRLLDYPRRRYYKPPILRSEARLDDIEIIRTCFSGGRCTGILIRYSDASESVLGRWYESQNYHNATIYDSAHHGRFNGLRFILSIPFQSKVRDVTTIDRRSNELCSKRTALTDIYRGVSLSALPYIKLLD